MPTTSNLFAKVSIGEPWNFCTPTGEGSFSVKIEKIESTFILAKVVSPFEWNGSFIRYIIGMCRHVGSKISDAESQEGVHLNIAALDNDFTSIQQLGLKKAWDSSKLFLIGKMISSVQAKT